MRRRTAVALIAAALLAPGPAGLASRAGLRGYVGRFVWTGDSPDFGGFSDIKVAPDGGAFTTLSDRGTIVTGQFLRDAQGRISAISATEPQRLKWPHGKVPPDFRFDTEGLALAADGSFYVSCEYIARVLHYTPAEKRPAVLPIPPEFLQMGSNKALEALAIDAQGRLYTLPEMSIRPDGAYQIFRFADGAWDQPFRIASQGSFLPVGADFGPDGRLYILERQFLGLGGFASRVVRLDPARQGLIATETVLQTPPGYFGNLEGIAVWRDPQGALRLTMIADDNFLSVLGTEVVEFRVPD